MSQLGLYVGERLDEHRVLMLLWGASSLAACGDSPWARRLTALSVSRLAAFALDRLNGFRDGGPALRLRRMFPGKADLLMVEFALALGAGCRSSATLRPAALGRFDFVSSLLARHGAVDRSVTALRWGGAACIAAGFGCVAVLARLLLTETYGPLYYVATVGYFAGLIGGLLVLKAHETLVMWLVEALIRAAAREALAREAFSAALKESGLQREGDD